MHRDASMHIQLNAPRAAGTLRSACALGVPAHSMYVLPLATAKALQHTSTWLTRAKMSNFLALIAQKQINLVRKVLSKRALPPGSLASPNLRRLGSPTAQKYAHCRSEKQYFPNCTGDPDAHAPLIPQRLHLLYIAARPDANCRRSRAERAISASCCDRPRAIHKIRSYEGHVI